jgi:Ras-related protein Rab-1A
MTSPDTTDTSTDDLSSDSPTYTHAAKVIVVGAATVGKTSLIVRFVKGIFNPSYILTIGVNFYVHDINLADKVLRLQIWDTAGQERFGPIRKLYYYGTKGVILVYDKTNVESFEKLEFWLNEIKTHTGDVPIILVGNKADLEEIITFEQGKQFAQNHQLTFLEASAKTGHHTLQIFNLLATHVNDFLSRTC